jgi:methionyl-tRNA synthetase
LNAGALWPRIEAEKGVVNVTDQNQPAAGVPATQADPAAAQAAPAAQAAATAPSYITIDDFAKVELRTAKVLEAERMPKSQKLLKLKVDAGDPEPRTILAGIAESYEPEALIGKSIVIVANLAPRKMMGLESQGMVLAASPDGGKAIVLNSEPSSPGTRVR